MKKHTTAKTASQLQILTATLEHVRPIHRLVESYRFRLEGLDAAGFLLPVEIEEIQALVEDGVFFVAELDGEFAGCVSLVEYDGIAELRSLAVEERFQRRGIATKLIERCKKAALDRGYESLYTLTQDHSMRPFEISDFSLTNVPVPKLEKYCTACPLFRNGCVEKPLVAPLLS